MASNSSTESLWASTLLFQEVPSSSFLRPSDLANQPSQTPHSRVVPAVVVKEEVMDSLGVVWEVSLADESFHGKARSDHCALGSLKEIWICHVDVSLENHSCSLVAFCKRKILKPLLDLSQPPAVSPQMSVH